MTFAMPSILAGLIGIAIPIVIHLLHRRKSRPVRWGAMQFLGPMPAPMARRRNVTQWLLMALRMAAIALAGLALAAPRLSARGLPRTLRSDTPADIALVIDHGVSAGRMSHGQTAFDRSLDAADAILRELRTEDSVCVVMAEHTPRLLGKGIVRGSDPQSMAELRQALRNQGPGLTDSSIPDAIAVARQTLVSRPGSIKRVLVISDLQRSAWHPRDLALWRSALLTGGRASSDLAGIYSFPIPQDAEFSDASVSDVHIEPTLLGRSQPLHIRCTVSNLGTKPLNPMSAKLSIDDVESDNRPIPVLSLKSIAPLTFDLSAGIPTVGSHRIKVVLTNTDALAADDVAFASIDVLDPIPILIVDGSFSSAGDTSSSQFLQAALHPNERSVLNPFVVPLNALASVHLNDFAAIILNDCPTLPANVRDELISYTRAGHGLWCILGPRTQSDFIRTNLVNTGLFPSQSSAIRSAADPGDVATIKDTAHPVTAAIAASGGNPLAGSLVRKWWAVGPDDPATQVLIATSTGDPLVMERPLGSAGGAIIVWATSADGAWSNWNLMPNFVPLANETVHQLAAGQLLTRPPALLAGQPIEWTSNRPLESVTITRPDSTAISRRAIPNDERWLITYPDTFQPGFYTLNDSTQGHYFGVNIDPRQLESAPLDSDDLRWLVDNHALNAATPIVTPEQIPEIIRPRTDQIELSPLLGFLLLFALAGESILSHLMVRSAGRPRAALEKLPTQQPELIST